MSESTSFTQEDVGEEVEFILCADCGSPIIFHTDEEWSRWLANEPVRCAPCFKKEKAMRVTKEVAFIDYSEPEDERLEVTLTTNSGAPVAVIQFGTKCVEVSHESLRSMHAVLEAAVTHLDE